jgi:cytochrome c biogenesis protein CcdA
LPQKRIDAMGVWGALLLGVLFAVSFCPNSALLFFGSLIPLAIEVKSRLVVPMAYGVGTALPVILFAILLAVSAQHVGKAFNVLSQVEWWARRVTGVVFIVVGVLFTLRYVFDLQLPFEGV